MIQLILEKIWSPLLNPEVLRESRLEEPHSLRKGRFRNINYLSKFKQNRGHNG